MKISYNWLKDFISIDMPADAVAEILTDIGLEVETVEKLGVAAEDLKGIVVGEVVECFPHPNADKLRCTKVDTANGELLNIVCGAPNVRQGLKVAVATLGTTIKVDKKTSFEIKKAKIRGEVSEGMLCSEKELNLGNDTSGIWELPTNFETGSTLAENLDLETDYIFEIGLTPNRADAMSHMGVARDLYAALKFRNASVEWIYQEAPVIAKSTNTEQLQITLPDADCNRYCGLLLSEIEIKPSPAWLQKRLRAIDISPKNNVVDITNYVMHSIGQPMHAFDAEKLNAPQIQVQRAGNTVEFATLDGAYKKLQGSELMIWDSQKPIAIAGVMGGAETSVTETTTSVLLESAHFEPVTVRKTAKSHSIHSDSSFRFERGTDPTSPPKGIYLAVKLLQEYANAQVISPLVDVQNTLPQGAEITFRLQKATEIIGQEIPEKDIESILQLLEIEILQKRDQTYQLQIPAYRTDVTREIDLIEDIMRIYGYNRFQSPSKINMALVAGEGFQEENLTELLSTQLVAQGFHEAMNLSLYHQKYDEWLDFDSSDSVQLLNALSAELSVMRRSMLPGLLQNVVYNVNRKQEKIALFEFGYVYKKISEGYLENKRLALILSGLRHAENWQSNRQYSGFYQLKGIVDNLLQSLQISYKISQINNQLPYEQHLVYTIGQEVLLEIGIISGAIANKFDVNQAVFYADINLEILKGVYFQQDSLQYQNIATFPLVRRDLALLIDKNIQYQQLVNEVEELKIKELKHISLFDVYEGDKLPNNKKSYALAFELQDQTKTMTDQEIDAIMQKIIQKLEKFGAELRKS